MNEVHDKPAKPRYGHKTLRARLAVAFVAVATSSTLLVCELMLFENRASQTATAHVLSTDSPGSLTMTVGRLTARQFGVEATSTRRTPSEAALS
jgi:hypothetical protein